MHEVKKNSLQFKLVTCGAYGGETVGVKWVVFIKHFGSVNIFESKRLADVTTKPDRFADL